ncbi:MAG: hypothetical protein COA57_16630 [Flavobacteriales bacterium]|nr:MAG: hypothetical protein COA57_16630 [Flavobacteriales bacterium]
MSKQKNTVIFLNIYQARTDLAIHTIMIKQIKFTAIAVLLIVAFACKKDVPIDPPLPPQNNDTTNTDTTITQPPVQTTPWPEWIFHHWVWEDESTQQSAIQLVDDYLAHDIPVGAIIIDSPWETGYNTFEFDLSTFYDPQGMIDYFHSKDVKVMMWITGIINIDQDSLYNYAAANGYFMQNDSASGPEVVNWWKGDGSLIDFFNPNAVAWWKTLLDKTLDLGIDGWKCDGTDYYVFGAAWSPYLNDYVERLDYSHAYYRLFHDYTRKKLGNDRVNTCRPIDNYGFDVGGDLVSFASTDINWCGWVGDQDGDFSGLEAALNNMYYSAEYGYLAFGSDIGGYREDITYAEGRSKEVLIRWAQMGALSPIMENGGGGEHRPWMFDTETTDIYQMFAKLHHAFIPYLMEQAETCFTQGKSMMTFFNKSDYSYLLGTDVFVAPFLQVGISITVSFPAGKNWVYLFDKTQTYSGGTLQTLIIPYAEFPVFIEENSDLLNTIDVNNL